MDSTGSARSITGWTWTSPPVLTRIPQGVRDFFACLRARVDRVGGRVNHVAMDPRLDTVENDLAVLASDVAVIKRDVADLKIRTHAIELRLVALDQRLTDELPHFATKADLETLRTEFERLRTEIERLRTDMEKMKSDMLKWFIAGWVTMFFSLASLQIMLFKLANP